MRHALVMIQETFPDVRAEVSDNQSIRIYGLKDGAGVNQMLVKNHIAVHASEFHHMDMEIRTTLTGAAGYVQLAQECREPVKQERYLQTAGDRLKELGDMLEVLFLYTKLIETVKCRG